MWVDLKLYGASIGNLMSKFGILHRGNLTLASLTWTASVRSFGQILPREASGSPAVCRSAMFGWWRCIIAASYARFMFHACRGAASSSVQRGF